MALKALFIILDGLGDRGAQTPLSQAETPNLDKLVPSCSLGSLYTLGPGEIPGSDTAHLALFGYDPHKYYPGRGPFEALGAGVDLKKGDVSFRTNLCTIDENMIITDRRAGRTPLGMDQLYAAVDNMNLQGVAVRVLHTVEHRGAVVFSGPGLSAEVGNTDPHEDGQGVQEVRALADGAEKMASIINAFTNNARAILKDHSANVRRIEKGLKPGNMIVMRGAGMFEPVESISQRFGISAACVAGGALYKGVAKYVGMDIIQVPRATGTIETDLADKAGKVLQNADKYDLIFAHIKATDSCGHDGYFDGKKKMIERIDKEFITAVKDKFDLLVLTGDHSTPVGAGRHTCDSVPLLLWHANCRQDGADKFCEAACRCGSFGQLTATQLVKIILDYMDKGEMFGE